MATPTYTALATTTLSSAVGSVTFSSIPASYRDLVLIASGATTTSDTVVLTRFNNDATDHYSYVQMYGEASAGSDTNTLEHIFTIFGGTGSVGNVIFNIMDYSATDKHKTVLTRENNLGISWTGARATRWPSTTAVNEIDLVPRSGNFASGSTFSLYGIEA